MQEALGVFLLMLAPLTQSSSRKRDSGSCPAPAGWVTQPCFLCLRFSTSKMGGKGFSRVSVDWPPVLPGGPPASWYREALFPLWLWEGWAGVSGRVVGVACAGITSQSAGSRLTRSQCCPGGQISRSVPWLGQCFSMSLPHTIPACALLSGVN